MKELQTPHRDPTSSIRRSKSTTDLSKNLHKASKKKLSPAFTAVSGDEPAVLEPLKEFPEVSDDNPFAESAENFIAPMDSMDTPSSNQSDISDLTSQTLSPFSVITSYNHVPLNASGTKCENDGADSTLDEIKIFETELVIKYLREARIQVMNSKNAGSSMKILEALINIIIEEFNGGVHEGSGWLKKIQSKKVSMCFLSLVMWVYVMFMLRFLKSHDVGYHAKGPTPT